MIEPSCDGVERLNCFALVAYLPNPLAAFLDELRRDLEPATLAPRAHLTILPPRPMAAGSDTTVAWAELKRSVARFGATTVRLGPIEVFPETNVVYVSVAPDVMRHLRQIHDVLNAGPFEFRETYEYHPHLTLAQGLTQDEAEAARAEAVRRWAQYRGNREFVAETLTFVQSSVGNHWHDLAGVTLKAAHNGALAHTIP